MEKDLLKAYTARISQASRSELVVIMYEIILSDIASAKTYFEAGETDSYLRELKHAQRFLNELMATLDYRYEQAYQLMSLYIYINKSILTAIYQKKNDILTEIESILQILMEGFKGIIKEDKAGPVMQNTQQLYAGLTYGKGVLNETYLNPNEQSRGFKA
ncbi:flagellar export chaperone FliS [Anaerocolumna sp. MB42-C2]|uniref:flagellar export chaperone FliS n=1 Tax=Anaerocolumna sp. MB42-C2 TaxID=3070997 RepID=UPI0027E10E2F|nr:flagellar protein FliS [Anaerocolumna sp. MB42-C2]WMJ85450.1 flagellar protein FliS [Anaerocolumna sp. MB42-C2]